MKDKKGEGKGGKVSSYHFPLYLKSLLPVTSLLGFVLFFCIFFLPVTSTSLIRFQDAFLQFGDAFFRDMYVRGCFFMFF